MQLSTAKLLLTTSVTNVIVQGPGREKHVELKPTSCGQLARDALLRARKILKKAVESMPIPMRSTFSMDEFWTAYEPCSAIDTIIDTFEQPLIGGPFGVRSRDGLV